MKVFLDTNIVIDFLAKREDFFQDASVIFEMLNRKMFEGIISSLTIVNCAYILKKAYSKEIMTEKIKWLIKSFTISRIDESVIKKAVRLNPNDFDDAVQYASAVSANSDVIISRDEKGFIDFKDILIMNPSVFLDKCK